MLVSSYQELSPGDWFMLDFSKYGSPEAITLESERVTHVVVRDPLGMTCQLAVRGRATQRNGASWEWNYSFTALTLTPSIARSVSEYSLRPTMYIMHIVLWYE